MQSFLNAKFLNPGKKTSPDITILLCIKIMLNVFSFGNTFVFFATLRHFGRYQQFDDAVYGVYINVLRQVQTPYRLRVIQTLISRRSAGSDSSIGLRTRINDASRQIGRRFESVREPQFSRFPRPNPVARRVCKFHHGVGVQFHAHFC